MKFFDYIKGLFSKGNFLEKISAEDKRKLEMLNVQRLAIMNAISIIAASAAKYNFNFFKNDVIQFNDDWYAFNFEPNRNQNKQELIYDIIYQIAVNGSALMVKLGDEYFIADSFSTDKTRCGFGEARFWDIEKNEKRLDITLNASEVAYFQIDDPELNKLLRNTALEYSNLLSAAGVKFKNTAYNKGILKIEAQQSGTPEAKEEENKRFNAMIQNFYGDGNAVLPLKKNLSYEELGKYKTSSSSEDVERMTNEIYSLVAQTFGIPLEILQRKANDNSKQLKLDFYNDCVEKYTNVITTECNRKFIGRDYYLGTGGTKLRMEAEPPSDKDDLLDERLFNTVGSGIYCIDEIREMKGLKPCNTNWSKKHLVSKNLTTIENLNSEVTNNE